MIKCFASGGSGGGLRLSRNARFSDGEYRFPSYNPRQDLAVKRALGLNPAFMGTVQVESGSVTQMHPSSSYGYRVYSAQHPVVNMRTVTRPRGRRG